MYYKERLAQKLEPWSQPVVNNLANMGFPNTVSFLIVYRTSGESHATS